MNTNSIIAMIIATILIVIGVVLTNFPSHAQPGQQCTTIQEFQRQAKVYGVTVEDKNIHVVSGQALVQLWAVLERVWQEPDLDSTNVTSLVYTTIEDRTFVGFRRGDCIIHEHITTAETWGQILELVAKNA